MVPTRQDRKSVPGIQRPREAAAHCPGCPSKHAPVFMEAGVGRRWALQTARVREKINSELPFPFSETQGGGGGWQGRREEGPTGIMALPESRPHGLHRQRGEDTGQVPVTTAVKAPF